VAIVHPRGISIQAQITTKKPYQMRFPPFCCGLWPVVRLSRSGRETANAFAPKMTPIASTIKVGQPSMERRQFSGGMKGKNLRYLNETSQPASVSRVGFLLLEHFSLPAFTQTLDTLVTANLLRPELFASRTYGCDEGEVISDLGLVIRPDARLDADALHEVDLLVICGGFRTELKAGEGFIQRLLQDYRCAIHPEHRPALAEVSKATHVTSEPYVIDRDRLTASSPSGAFHMALDWIKGLHGKALVEGIEDILAFEESRYRRIKPTENVSVSAPLREVVKLMDSNLEEPLELDQLAVYAGRSRRQLERLFKEQLGTTPQRYYMELRVTEARRLLQHTELSQVEVLVACGFVSPSHFSKCYSSYFGYRPSKEKRLVK
jgi:AraC family transcriptional regulator, glycine betaine-responsive activator